MSERSREDSALLGGGRPRLSYVHLHDDSSASTIRSCGAMGTVRDLHAASEDDYGSDDIDGEDDDGFDPNRSIWRFQPPSSLGDSSRSKNLGDSLTSSIRSTSSLPARWIESITLSDRKAALRLPGVGAAAFLIRDAVVGERDMKYEEWYDPYRHVQKEWRNFLAILARRLSGSWYVVRTVQVAAWAATLVSFVEEPHWCRSMAESSEYYGSCADILKARGPSIEGEVDIQYYPNAHAAFITYERSKMVEWTCANIIAVYLILKLACAGFNPYRFFLCGAERSTRCVRTISLIFIYRGLIAGYASFTPIVRVVLLASFLKDLQRELWTMYQMLPQILDILALLGVLIVFWGWGGVVLFYNTEEGNEHFSNIVEACWTLYQCVTTVNYPDVMMSSYNKNHFSALYFVTFMILSFFFLMNLILASVVNSYDKSMDERRKSREKLTEENLKKAFELLDPDGTGHVSRDSIMAVFCVLNEDFTEFRTLGKEETKLLFGFLDKDGDSVISAEEFQNFGHVLLLRFTRLSAYETFVQAYIPKLFQSTRYQAFCNAVRSKQFERTIEVILVLNAIFVGVQSYPELAGESQKLDPSYSNGAIDTYWEIVETIFSVIYVFEVSIKVMVNGWRRYWESTRNRFDFTVTVMVVAVTVYVYTPNDFNDTRLIRFFLMTRVLRLIRLLGTVKQFQMIGSISASILSAAASVVLFLFMLMYCFAVLGMMQYGGMITRDPRNPLSFQLLNTVFSNSEYWANNFNDLFSGMNVLFNLLVVNNWTECESGFEAVTEAKWVRWYFLSFHVLGVILVSNLVVAFTINSIFQQLESLHNSRAVDSRAPVQGHAARFDASEITGTKTDASGEYIARIEAVHKDIKLNEHQGLVNLF